VGCTDGRAKANINECVEALQKMGYKIEDPKFKEETSKVSVHIKTHI